MEDQQNISTSVALLQKDIEFIKEGMRRSNDDNAEFRRSISKRIDEMATHWQEVMGTLSGMAGLKKDINEVTAWKKEVEPFITSIMSTTDIIKTQTITKIVDGSIKIAIVLIIMFGIYFAGK